MAEKFVQNGEISLWTEDFGDASNPTVLLMNGFGSSGVMWPVTLCKYLAANGHHVIRYDQRDTGLSGAIDYKKHPYRLIDLAVDATHVLDAYGVNNAHIVGTSMGGCVSQLMALRFPERVKTLILLSSTFNFVGLVLAVFMDKTDWLPLPGPNTSAVRHVKALNSTDPKNHDLWLRKYVRLMKISSGNKAHFDPLEWKGVMETVSRHVNHDGDLSVSHNHMFALRKGPFYVHSENIHCPILIIHGSRDPYIPLKHARVFAHKAPNAKRVVIYGMGHLLAKEFEKDVSTALLNFLRDSSGETNKPMVHERIATDVCNFWHDLFSVFWHKA
ncbi:MAG: alpha/beta hydrolase [Alphaproteobacteria bacterium]|nr:alpha/beta hydrolase [Alphaproteobacteria bacterium]